jgi:replicative DNA helicase
MVMQLPNNIDIEKSLIAHCLVSKSAEIVEMLSPDDFFNSKLSKIFSLIADSHRKGEPIDVSMIVGNGISGTDLAKLMEFPVAVSFEYSCNKLKELTAIRKTIQTANDIVQKCLKFSGFNANDLINEAQSSIMGIEIGASEDCFKKIGPSCEKTVEHIEALNRSGSITGITSGYPEVDKITGGFQMSDLIIIAARPGMGKTAFAINISENASRAGHPVAIFSLEMSLHQINCRMISRSSKVNSKSLRNGTVYKTDWQKINDSVAGLYDIPMYVDDTPALHYMEIRRRARKLKREKGIEMVIIDYLQLAKGDNPKYREQEVSSISQGFKAMAKELNIPVIALSQLNRKMEGNADKRPNLTHLRESGSLEQDSDIVIFIHREDYYKKKDEQKDGKAEIIFEKHRNGPTGWGVLDWIPHFSSFENQIGGGSTS